MRVYGIRQGLCITYTVIIACNLSSCMQAISDWAKSRTLQEQRRFLPVYDCRDELLQVIRENQVVVVVGETGSGKTTQVMCSQLHMCIKYVSCFCSSRWHVVENMCLLI